MGFCAILWLNVFNTTYLKHPIIFFLNNFAHGQHCLVFGHRKFIHGDFFAVNSLVDSNISVDFVGLAGSLRQNAKQIGVYRFPAKFLFRFFNGEV